MDALPHKAGFVNIIGKPNVGKSTLMNALVGERLSIITAKAQTTRHRIAGILSGPNFQIIYSDTPGMIKPQYALQKAMMKAVRGALSDADVLLWVVDARDKTIDVDLKGVLERHAAPVLLLVNKVDLVEASVLEEVLEYWATHASVHTMLPIAALKGYNVPVVLEQLLTHLPEHPPYYPQEMLSDKPERFFAAEIIREKILLSYSQEIPYSVEVTIDNFEETERLVRISAVIYVERQSQKGILIGHQGSALKKVGMAARKDLERLLNKSVFLEQHVKVLPRWRQKSQWLQQFGYV
ncbi:MAG: GTPase Era [Bacteroidota bacterium]